MLVVSNTSLILNLAIIDRLGLLRGQFGKVMNPPAVSTELRTGESLPGNEAVRQALDDGWLRVVPLKDESLVLALQVDLDRGEAEAIALAVHVGAARVLLVEREARQRAKDMGLEVTGLLGVLLRAKLHGAIPSLGEEVTSLPFKTWRGFASTTSSWRRSFERRERRLGAGVDRWAPSSPPPPIHHKDLTGDVVCGF